MYFRCWLAITERGGAADDNSGALIAAPRDGFKRSCDKVANRVSFYINPVQREREEEEERERDCIILVGEGGGRVFPPNLLPRNLPCVFTRVHTRKQRVHDRSVTSRLRATGNKVGCGTTDCHLFYSAKRVANCLSLCWRDSERWHRLQRDEKVI